jgi:hypothetical protein
METLHNILMGMRTAIFHKLCGIARQPTHVLYLASTTNSGKLWISRYGSCGVHCDRFIFGKKLFWFIVVDKITVVDKNILRLFVKTIPEFL